MHLSLLSDGYLSDSFADAPDIATGRASPFGEGLRDGLLRGMLFVLALVLPLALTVALSPAQGAGPDRPTAPTHVRVTHLSVR